MNRPVYPRNRITQYFPGDEPECDCDCLDTAQVTFEIEPTPRTEPRYGWLRWLFIGAWVVLAGSVLHWMRGGRP